LRSARAVAKHPIGWCVPKRTGGGFQRCKLLLHPFLRQRRGAGHAPCLCLLRENPRDTAVSVFFMSDLMSDLKRG